jgi:hypothetical protein
MHHSSTDESDTQRLGLGLQVIAESKGIQLLYDSYFSIFKLQTILSSRLIDSTPNWSVAYRTWLGLVRKKDIEWHSQSNLAISAEVLLKQFEVYQGAPAFGRLIYQRDRNDLDLLQYAVQLDDDLAVCWRPMPQSLLGQMRLEDISWRRYRPAKWVEELPRFEILRSLQWSVQILHQRWSYSLFQFNNEHWARLVTTGQCHCYQTNALKTLETFPDSSGRSTILEENLDVKKVFYFH